jgi:hypothetical protein
VKKLFFLLITVALYFIGCSNNTPTSPNSKLIVVRGYLYAGEPVQDIQITGTLPLGSEETKAPAINNAQVSLVKDGVSYDLVSSPGDSGYYFYDGGDLTVNAGDEFRIEVRYQNEDAYATTIVPQAPEKVTISNSTLRFPDMDTMWELMQQGVSMDSIRKSMTLTVSWEQKADALYYIVVENVDENPVEVESQFGRGPGRFISQPVATGEYTVNAMMMTYLGRHRVKVYRVNQEYADLYRSRNQDSRDLNEPLTNIVNGLGVFSAFNSDSVFFEFVQ